MMDVRASLNSEGNLSVVTGDGHQSFTDDSFFAKAPPQAASTVGRSKARRFTEDTEGGSFLDNMPLRRTPVIDEEDSQTRLSFGMDAPSGARPQVANRNQPATFNGEDWGEQDDKSSLGIINVEDMDLSSNNLLLECPLEDMMKRPAGNCLETQAGIAQISTSHHQLSSNNNNNSSSGSSTMQPFLSNQFSGSHQFSGSQQLSGHQASTDSNNSQDSKPDQPFARSQLGTVKKNDIGPPKADPIATAIRQTLFSQIGEEAEEGDVSVHQVELGEEELRELDIDFDEMDNSGADDSEPEETSKTPTNKGASSGEIDSIYLRPGLMGEEQRTRTTLPYLSKVSLFDGGSASGSEIDTEDELELARQAQGTRHEAAGQASQDTSRPGLEGDCSDDAFGANNNSGVAAGFGGHGSRDDSRGGDRDRQLPITQRQSAEGDVVSSPVPGDGGGGGDGSSGSDSDIGGRSNMTDTGHAGGHHGYRRTNYNTQRETLEQEQRVKPMGDDLLSEIHFRSSNATSNQDDGDTRLHSRYLTPSSPADSTSNPSMHQPGGAPSFNLDDFMSSQNEAEEEAEFDPGNRLEASGFNADDFSALMKGGGPNSNPFDMGPNSNPFDMKGSSFGSWGAQTPEPARSPIPSDGDTTPGMPLCRSGSDPGLRVNVLSGEDQWCELDGSVTTSQGSKHSSMGGGGGVQSRTSPLQQGGGGGAQSRTSPFQQEVETQSGGSLGKRVITLGSPSRSSQGHQRSATEGSQASSKNSLSFGKSGSQHPPTPDNFKPSTRDADPFKKPAIPALKSAGKFTRSVSKSKASTSQQQSSHSSGRSSTNSSRSSSNSARSGTSAKSGSEVNDLAFKMSLTMEAEEQRHGLKRVASLGGTSALDMTVPDEDFFGSDNGRAMLDADEEEFQKENVISQEDAMTEQASGHGNDSWAYRSVMSIARPSWIEDPQEEEQVHVRISVGSFMRGRTGALGSLDGHDNTRPDFGLHVTSPPKEKSLPVRLLEVEEINDESTFEETRTSGVGQYGNGSPRRHPSEDNLDDTLTVSSLHNTPQRPALGAVVSSNSTLCTATPGADNPANRTNIGDSTKLSMGELSFLLKQSSDPKVNIDKFLSMHSLKSRSRHKENEPPRPTTTTTSSLVNHPQKHKSETSLSDVRTQSTVSSTSTRPVMQTVTKVADKPSLNLSRSFPKVTDGQKSFLSSASKKDRSSGCSKSDSVLSEKFQCMNEEINKSETESIPSPVMSSPDHGSPKPSSSRSDGDDELFSPNASLYCPGTSGLFDKLEEFKFADNLAAVKQNLSKQLQDQSRQDFTLPSRGIQHGQEFLGNDREKTPPPDGEDHQTAVQSQHKMLRGKQLHHNQPTTTTTTTSAQHSRQNQNLGNYGDYSHYTQGKSDSHSPSRIPVSSRSKETLDQNPEMPKLNSSNIDHGYMPGHHIPDGTEYSVRSDYAHVNHKGMSREDVAGVEDVGLAESRGFDMLKGTGRGNTRSTSVTSTGSLQLEMRGKESGAGSQTRGTDSSAGSQNRDTDFTSSSRGRDTDSCAVSRQYDTWETDHSNMSRSGSSHIPTSVSSKSGPLSLQPTQSRSPMLKSAHQHDSVNFCKRYENKKLTAQEKLDQEKLDSWTQTSLVFKPQSLPKPELQSQNQNLNPANFTTDSNQNVTDYKTRQNSEKKLNVTVPPQFAGDSVSHQPPHFARDSVSQQQIVSDSSKPYLLTKTSLMQTDFARQNLPRSEYNRETLDRINTMNSTATAGFSEMDTTEATVHPDFSQMDLETTTASHFKAPYDPRQQRSNQNFCQLPVQSTPARSSVCPVEAPGVVNFDACCVGVAKKQVLTLTNPTDKWMDCTLQIMSLEIEGNPVAMGTGACPFEMRRKKVIIGPNSSEGIDVLFVPKQSGTHTAQAEILSNSFRKNGDVRQAAIPVNVALMAIGEDPLIKVTCDDEETDCVEFGELVWGGCQERTIGLRNMRHATVPLRLAIASTSAWHCFAFEPEGRMSDVSVISGQQPPVSSGYGRSIVNLSLPGAHEPFSYHEVKIWCRPPEKSNTNAMARQKPEQFTCRVDVEVDIPCCKYPKIKSLVMKATVGVQKFRVNVQKVQFSAGVGQLRESRVMMLNVGNLDLNLRFGISDHRGVFSVSPSNLHLKAGQNAEVNVAFTPQDTSITRYDSLLLMQIYPNGELFEVVLQGELIKETPRQTPPKILSNCMNLDFRGVPIGTSVVKKFELINKGKVTETVKIKTRSPEILLVASKEPTSEGGRQVREETLEPDKMVSVFVLYTPLSPGQLAGSIAIKPDNCHTQFKVKVSGYGGVGRLVCADECLEPDRPAGLPRVALNPARQAIKEVMFRNTGVRPVLAKLAVFQDRDCKQPLGAGDILVRPASFLAEPGRSQKVVLMVGMEEGAFVRGCQRSGGVAGYLGVAYHDVLESGNPSKSSLVVGLVLSSQYCPVVPAPTTVTDMRLCTPARSAGPTSRPTHPSLTHTDSQQERIGRSVTVTEEYRAGPLERLGRDSTGGWSLEPQQIILYCSKRGNHEFERLYIHNHNNSDISYEIAWPGDMLSLTQGGGTVKGRENTWIHIYPSARASRNFDQLPWSGEVTVSCGKQIKVVSVEIRQDNSPVVEEVPEQEELVPVTTSHAHHGGGAGDSGANRLGSLEVSRKVVTFPTTAAEKMAEETIELRNYDSQTIRWMFSSFAAPYLRKKADHAKQTFRVSYKVFDFSRQFGKLNGGGSVQLTLHFMPRSSGLFSQYWDLQTTGNVNASSRQQDFLRIHLTGEGVEPTEDRKTKPSLLSNLLPTELPRSRCKLEHEVLRFHARTVGESVTLKANLKNNHSEEVQVEVTAPKPPFYVKHTHFKIEKKRYLRFPVDFHPSRPGRFSDVVKFQVSKGESLVLNVIGEC